MNENYPSILDRIKSTLIDSIIIITFMWIFTDTLEEFNNVPDYIKVSLFMILLMYEPICTVYGATLGNHKMQIRVRSNSDESKKINIFQGLVRYFFKLLFGWISFITIFFNPKSRAIHHIISGSVMIKIL